jgi:hypothetical protein
MGDWVDGVDPVFNQQHPDRALTASAASIGTSAANLGAGGSSAAATKKKKKKKKSSVDSLP